MKINILLPYKEKFDENKASSVAITVKNNMSMTNFLPNIRVFGQNVEKPLFKDNFVGLNYSILSLKSKNQYLAFKMLKTIDNDVDDKQLIEIHNRPYLIDHISKGNKFPISLFLHNDPQNMKGSKSIKEREKILKKCAAIFCVSKYIKSQFMEGLQLIRNNKVHVLYNGVNKKLKKFPRKKKEVLFVGRLVSEKGVELYVDVINSVASNHPDWSFGLIGSVRLGEENYNSYAKTLIEKFQNIGPQAKFFGFKNHCFVEKKMKTASIIVIPSIWQEPFGLVAAEAMSNGIAVIASKVGGIPEIVRRNGILIQDINYDKLKKSLLELLKNEDLRIGYQKKAWANFDFLSNTSSKRLDYYRKIICKTFYH